VALFDLFLRVNRVTAAIELLFTKRGGDMKKQALRVLTMLSLVLVFGVAAANAQSLSRRINVPFSFTVGQQTMTAGEYTLEPLRRDSRNMWKLQNRVTGESILFTTNEVRSLQSATTTKVVFSNYNGEYYLSQIWSAGDNSGREVKKSQQERQLAQHAGKPEHVSINN